MLDTPAESPVDSLARRAKKAGVRMADICKRAKVAQSTPSRWKAGTFEPKLRTLRRLEEALAELAAETAPANPAGE